MMRLLQAMFSSLTTTWHGPSPMDVRAAIHEVQEGKSINSAPSARASRKRRLHKFQVAGHITYHPEEAETC